MKFSLIASLALLRQVAGQSSCPSDLTQQLQLSSTETLYYDVVDGNVFCARIESQSEGWLGFGISPSGAMTPSEAVIGLPDEGTVLKYVMTNKSTSGVVPMSDDKQTLIGASIVQQDGMTTMTFGKIMNEDEYPLVIGDNSCIYAQAGSNAFGYHGNNRGSFTLSLQGSTVTASTAAAAVTTAASSATEPAVEETPAQGSSAESADEGSSSSTVAPKVVTILLGAGAVASWFGL